MNHGLNRAVLRESWRVPDLPMDEKVSGGEVAAEEPEGVAVA